MKNELQFQNVLQRILLKMKELEDEAEIRMGPDTAKTVLLPFTTLLKPIKA